MIRVGRFQLTNALWAFVAVLVGVTSAFGQTPGASRVLGREDIKLYGIGLKVEPATQTVPKDIATIVSTFLQAPTQPTGLPPFAPDAEVVATLRGPSFQTPVELRVKPNSPFNIPPLTVPGSHVLENVRLISGGEVLLRGVPDHARIEVIEKLLVTQVTARALTAAEIREKGIVFDKDNFQAYNFSAAFAVQDQPVNLNFPVVLPRLQGASDTTTTPTSIPNIGGATLPTLQTIIPDTLKIQTRIPNLTVVGFTLQVPQLQGQQLIVPPIPGVVVIPGDIGFLNQYFSVMLMVGNVAPTGSNLVVTDLKAQIVLPAGNDNVAGSADDPLRMAQTTSGESPRLRIVAQPGPDGKVGTADDIPSLGPGESGNAEYLVEGRREGSHVVEMQMTGTLNGLPVGPVTINGRAAGAVLVRNPKFSLTFTHPEVVSAGEAYTLDVTVTNTSTAPANFVSLNLYPRNVSGATIIGEATRGIESILPGDSDTVSFKLVSKISGKVTAATLDSDENVQGRFLLKAAVGELGVPLSPDSLVLPKEANSLPEELRSAVLGMLGKAHAVATAPAAALPPDVRRFSRKIVIDRAIQAAEAGLRVSLNEPLPVSTAQLLMDFLGSDTARLAQLFPNTADREFELDNMQGFDELRRRSVRGDRLAEAVAKILASELATKGATLFLHDLAQAWSYRPGHVSILVSGNGQPLPARFSIADAQARQTGPLGDDNKILKEIPYSDALDVLDASGNVVARLLLIAAPQAGAFTVTSAPLGGAPANLNYMVSLVAPDAAGELIQTSSPAMQYPQQLSPVQTGAFTFTFTNPGGSSLPAQQTQTVVDPAPTVVSIIQQDQADVLRCEPEDPGTPVGRIVAVLFSEEVTPASVQDRAEAALITNFSVAGNKVVGVALQPGRRIAFVALRDPFGPFIPRQMTIANVEDVEGHAMPSWSGPMTPKVPQTAGVVSGRVINADGTPVAFANVRLFALLSCEDEPRWVGISSKPADANGEYQFDYVTRLPARILAVNQETGESRNVRFGVQRDGQRMNVDIVYLGRGTLSGTTYDESGRPLAQTALRVSSLTDGSEYGTQSDASGKFTIPGIPVGNFFVEAVNVTAHAQFSFAEYMPGAATVVTRDITLLDVEKRSVTVKQGDLSGHVLRADRTTPVIGVPVFVWYQSGSQPGVMCPGNPGPPECAIAMATTNGQGAFSFDDITAGQLRVSSFDQGALSEGQARIVLPLNGQAEVNVLLGGGLGTVKGVVLNSAGQGVAGASVGGGLSLTTTDSEGNFTLTDVPVGQREIVAVSQELGAKGKTTVDILEAGQTVNATIVFDPIGSVSGTIVAADGVTPVSNVKVYLFRKEGDSIIIAGQTTANATGGFQIPSVAAGTYQLSAFNASFTDGNIVPVALKFQGQNFRTTVRFRGAGGTITGKVFDDDGVTPLKARVGVSGDQVAIAGGQVAVGFERVQYFKITDTDLTTGAFSFNNLFVGPITVSAVGQFSPDPVSVETAIPAPNAQVTVNLKLQATSQIRGTVLLPNGVQPAGANVVVRYKSEAYKVICSGSGSGEEQCESIPQGIQEENAVTDEQGRFWFPIVNAGPFSISVLEPSTGRVSQIKGSVRAGEVADLSVRLFALGDVTLRVFSSNGTTPIPGASVQVQQLGYPQTQKTYTANNQGVVELTGGDAVPEGAFVVTATDPSNGFKSGRTRGVVTSSGEPITVDVYLYNVSGTVLGTVYATDGLTPVPNAEVIISNGAGPLAYAVTDGTGHYSVGTVPLGPISIDTFEARTGRRGAATGSVDVDNQQVTIDVVQAGLGMVRGTVLLDGELTPLKGWEVTLTQQSASGLSLPSLRTTTGVDGAFSFPGTSRGTVRITASKRDVSGQGGAQGWVEFEGQVVDVPVLVNISRPLYGGITGVVVSPNGTPAANAALELCYAGACGSGGLTTTAGSDGTFTLTDVPLGRFSIVAKDQVSGDTGSVVGEVAFEGDAPQVTIVLSGLARVSGVVLKSDGSPSTARVSLKAYPSSGCAEECQQDTAGNGAFSFINVPGRSFTVTAIDAISGLKGVAGGSLNPGEQKVLEIRLEPTATLSGRILRAAGVPALGAVAELVIDANGANERRIYQETGADGTFTFPAVPTKPYQLLLSDPIGPGIASRSGTLVGPVALGDIILDEAPPQVASVNPAPASTGVARTSNITITFTEPILPGTINATNVTLTGPNGPVTGTLDVTTNDTVVVFDPLTQLDDQATYTLRVKDVKDRVQKVMPSLYSASFTTVDVTAPTVTASDPVASAGGVTIYTPIRITFSEAVDTTRFQGAPVTVTGPAGPVTGVTSYLAGNTIVVFTPNLPLAEGVTYQVAVQKATDLAGLQQAAAFTFSFATTTRIPPTLTSLVTTTPQVVEGGVGRVVATPSPTSDVLFVDFYVNGVLAGTDRTSPFEFAFQATPAVGEPGSIVTVTAIPTDTSGNRGVVPGSAEIAIVADQPAALTLAVTTPIGALSAKNGDRVVVNVQAADDLGVKQLGYRAATGNPVDALTKFYNPAVAEKSEEFAFHVPATAAPGSTILVEASAIDTKGQTSQAAPVEVTVVDAVLPSVQITGATSGTNVRPGQTTTVVVTANDLGGISNLTFTAGGLVTRTDTRTIDPPQNSVVATFTVVIPDQAETGQTLTLDATATDRSGNTAAATRVVLPIADGTAPTVSLQTSTGSLDATPGQSVAVIVSGEDSGLISELRLAGSGGMTFNSVRQVTPPLGSASRTFDVQIPASLDPGTQIHLTATAVDIAGNVSAPASITLTTISGLGVTLPSSQIVRAGETEVVTVQLATPAGPGGLRLDFSTEDPAVATVTPFITFAEGETTRTIEVTGVAGGTTLLRAFLQQVQRASMTISVSGGIVDGFVLDSKFQGVSGAQLTISGGNVTKAAVSGADGYFSVDGVPGPFVSVKALDPETRLRGYSSGTMTRANGKLSLNVVLMPAGAVGGGVFEADRETSAGAGVKVEIFEKNVSQPLATVFTNEAGIYEFPLVTLGQYRVEASAVNGRRARATVALTQSGDEVELPLVFIGTGTVRGVVRNSNGVSIAGAQLTLKTWDAFGADTPVITNAGGNGEFEFQVPVGSFSLEAKNLATGQGGSITGTITQHLQEVEQDIVTASYASLQGHVYRAGSTTPVVGARVTVNNRLSTTNENGIYRFEVLPLGSFTVRVSEPDTNGMAQTGVTLAFNGQEVEKDIELAPQGRLLVTVKDADGATVPGAILQIGAVNGVLNDGLNATTGDNGTALVERVLAGTINITATAGSLSGSVTGLTLEGDQLLEVEVMLEPTGTVTGVIYEPDGVTPAVSARVYLDGWQSRSTLVADGGVYRFTLVPKGTYSLRVLEGNLLRARTVTPVQITSNGQVIERNFTKIGLGTVHGRISFSNNDSAQDFSVTLRSQSPFPDVPSVTTNGGGIYEFKNVPIGPFTISTGDVVRQVLGEATGEITAHNQDLEIHIVLQNNAKAMPTSLLDGNGYLFDVQANGTIANGSSAFGGSTVTGAGASQLVLFADNQQRVFTGAAIASVEDAQREIAIRETGLHGLTVTRKVFVPQDGYFSRELELLTNPTADPIAVDVRVVNGLDGRNASVAAPLVASSSGDQLFTAADDQWVVFGQSNHNGFPGSGMPARALVMQGAAAAKPLNYALVDGIDPTNVGYGWTSLVVPPGQTVGLLHFIVQQTSDSAAQAAAQRLVQLPPEALQGLSASEMAAIVNFVMPEGGVSTVPALPALNGSITGQVLEGDSTTAIGSASVTFVSSSPLYHRTFTANAGSDGKFSFTANAASSRLIPQMPFTLKATYPNVTSVVSPETAGDFLPGNPVSTQNVAFTNTGMVSGRVRRANGDAAPGGTVSVSGRSINYAVGPDASYRIGGLLPGTYTVTGTAPVVAGGTALTAVGTAQITATVTTPLDLFAPATYNVTGTVTRASSVPAGNLQVRLKAGTSFTREVTTATGSGAFTFPEIPPGTYVLSATEPVSGIESVAQVVVTDANATQNLQLTAVGSVTGTVSLVGGGTANNRAITLRYVLANGVVGTLTKTTGPTGVYRFDGVPASSFIVEVNDSANQLYGQAAGTLTTDAQTVTLNFSLAINTISLPVTLYDANGYPYDFDGSGSVIQGQKNVFRGGSNGASVLQFSTQGSGVVLRFSDSDSYGVRELGGRQVRLEQQTASGLNISRRVYVPQQGYFARYVDTFRNTSGSPITVQMAYQTIMGSNDGQAPNVMATSTGDTSVTNGSDDDTRDTWATYDDYNDYDPFINTQGMTAVGTVFGGPNAPAHQSDLRFTNYGILYGLQFSGILQEWANVEIQPGQSVSFLNFIVQQTSRAAAKASAERLVQLPPEALEGLTAEERATIVNFNVPLDGQSTLEPLGGVTGKVSGQVTFTDTTAPYNGINVRLKSMHPIFSRTYSTSTNTSGNYTFTGGFGTPSSPVAIALENYTVTATIPATNLQKSVAGSFPVGQTTATADIVMDNAGSVTGTLRRSDLSPVAGATVADSRGRSVTTGSNGEFTFVGLPAGNVTLFVEVAPPSGESGYPWLFAERTVQIIAGQRVNGDLTLPLVGALSGVVTTAADQGAGNVLVTASGPSFNGSSFYRTVYTNALGQYLFTDLIPGAYTVTVNDSRVSRAISKPAVITGNASTAADFKFAAVGRATVTVTLASGQPAVNSKAQFRPVGTTFWNSNVSTNASGVAVLNNIPEGAFEVRASHPQNDTIWGEGNGVVVTENQNVAVAVQLPGTGAVTGRLTTAKGAVAPFGEVQIRHAETDAQLRWTTADQFSNFSFVGIPLETPVRLAVPHPQLYTAVRYGQTFILHANGESHQEDISRLALASVQVHATHPGGAVWSSLNVYVSNSADPYFNYRGNTNFNGDISLSQMPEGAFSIRFTDPNTGVPLATVSGTITAEQDQTTIPFPVEIGQFGGVVTGTVFAADGTTPVPGAIVSLSDVASGTPLQTVTASATGAYSFNSFVFGPGGFSVRAWANYDPNITVTVAGTVPSEGTSVVTNLSLPAVLGTISGRVTAPDGTGIADVYLDVIGSTPGSGLWGYTDGDGYYSIPAMLDGGAGVTVRAFYPGFVLEKPASISAQGSVVTVNFTLTVTRVNITVRAVAGDQQTPVESAEVYVQTADGEAIASRSTGADGRADFADVWVPEGGLSLSGYYSFSNVFAEVLVHTTSTSQTADLVLPMSVVRGTVRRADNSPSNRPNAFTEDSQGETHNARRTTTAGGYIVFGTANGPFRLTVQDRNSGIRASFDGVMTDIQTPVIKDFVLPATGTVSGTFTYKGAPVVGESVTLISNSLGFDRYTYTDENGHFTFEEVPIGEVGIHGYVWDSDEQRYDYTANYGVLTAETPLMLNLTQLPGTTVSGVVRNADGVPQPGVWVAVDAFAGAGPSGFFAHSVQADDNGAYTMSNVPRGKIKVYASDPDGIERGVTLLTATGPATSADVTYGTGISLDHTFTADNGFEITVNGQAAIYGGSSPTSSGPISVSGQPYLNDSYMCCDYGPAVDMNGRQVTVGPFTDGPALLTRKVFVPESGNFVRHLEIIENSGGIARTVTLETSTWHTYESYRSRFVVLPGDTGKTYMVMDDRFQPSPQLQYSAVGYVMNGAGAVPVPTRIADGDVISGQDSSFRYSWRVTLQPGQKIAFMHFVVLRQPADADGADAQAQQLVNLTDPEALAGLSDEEKAAIANFIVP